MKTKGFTHEKDDFLIRASKELYQMKIKLTEEELEQVEMEKEEIFKKILQSEKGVSDDNQRNRLDELANKEANLQATWNEFEMTYKVGTIYEEIQPEEQTTELNPSNDEWFGINENELSEAEIEEALDELEQLRESVLTQDEERDLPDL